MTKTLQRQAAELRNIDNPKMTVRTKGAEHRDIDNSIWQAEK